MISGVLGFQSFFRAARASSLRLTLSTLLGISISMMSPSFIKPIGPKPITYNGQIADKDAVVIARHFGLSTDSSYRFERGVDPQLQRRAIERASELLLAIKKSIRKEINFINKKLNKLNDSSKKFDPKSTVPEKFELVSKDYDQTKITDAYNALIHDGFIKEENGSDPT